MRTDVVVVGAGFSGLAAALALKQAGARVLVLEARDRIAALVALLDAYAGKVDPAAPWTAARTRSGSARR